MRHLALAALFLSAIASAQTITVYSYAPQSAWPTTCGVLPYSFQVGFTYYVDTYDCNGNFSNESQFGFNGTGYCSGLAYF